MKYLLSLVAVALLSLSACSTTKTVVAGGEKASKDLTESEKVNNFFEEEFAAGLERNPTMYTYMGQKKRYDELSDISYEKFLEDYGLTKKSYKKIKTFNYTKLDKKTKLSYRLYKKSLESQLEGFKYAGNEYFVNQMHGVQSWIPSFMINMHRIDNASDAEAYIKRLEATEKFFADLLDNMKRQEGEGIKYPNFIFGKVIQDSKNIITGYPFGEGGKGRSPLYKDFKDKVSKLKISDNEKAALRRGAAEALKTKLGPAYSSLITYMTALEKKSKDTHGVWSLPDGKDYYNYKLREMTATDMTAPQIHNLGLAEVERIQNEMRDIMKKVRFVGDLGDFFTWVKGNDKFFYPATDAGRAQYLKDATAIIDKMQTRLDELFITKPKAKLIVKAVEPFREKSAGIAFYQPPALDGSRPGTYYVNLSDMKSVAKYDMEALAYHEGLPGHHMDNSINQEIKDIPMFRKFSHYTSFGEGWGLYSEYIPKEIGFYKDPYSDFGRLSMELWRATRLVVDTGIHYYKWSRAKSIKYLKDNTPNSQDEIDKGIDRYFVMPGQATAYKIGQLKILELRKKAKRELKDKFDIREFHDRVLGNGAIPLYELENQITEFIKENQE